MREWLLSVIGAAMLGSVAMALCPKGRVRTVARFLCALVCMLSLVSPLLNMEGQTLLPTLENYRAEGEALAAREQEKGENEQRIYIQEQCAAYILTEAQQLGVPVAGASVLARWDADSDGWLPAYSTVEAPYNAALAETIERQLGIAREAQRWLE